MDSMDNPSATSQGGVSISSKLAEELLLQVGNEYVKNQRSIRRWRNIKSAALGAVAFLVVVAGIGSASSGLGDNHVVSVSIEGGIGQGAGSADAIIPALKKAFEDKKAQAVILKIDSPGGIPADADRITQVIDHQKKETGKPVIAVIDGVGASAAYMIAVHADKIVAGRYSLVGSIGAIIQGWDYHEVMDKLGVKQRVFASGKLKSMLNPYAPMTDDAKNKAQEIVDRMALTFINEVKEARKGKLKEGDWYTGEVWPGNEALGIGLIDEIGTIDQFVQTNYGDLKVVAIKPEVKRPLLSVENLAPELIAKALEGVAGSFAAKNH